MLKKILAAMLALFAAAAFAAVDVNKATPAELDGVKGIGPVIAGKIVDERKNGPYKDWNDLITRVKGVGEGNAAKFSTEGLTVNGTSYQGAAPSAKADGKPAKTAPSGATAAKAAAKAEKAAATAVAAASAPGATSADAKAQAKKEAAEKRAAAKKEKEEKAAAAKAEKEAKAASAAESKKQHKAKAAADKASDAKSAKK